MRHVTSVLMCVLFISCASEEKYEPKVNPAALGMDNFHIESGMPVREVKKSDFFYKRCSLNSQRAFPSKIDYSCNDGYQAE